ncbi:MAG: hypothetical protein LQ344_001362 [Seirophora lacunosa]|nr:MAG: hypothetical protein LQ344_001362 [Seirophora lacunosa]
MCDQSVITSTPLSHKLEDILWDREDGKQFLDSISHTCRPAACRHVHIIICWAVFTQDKHVTAKGFFHILRKYASEDIEIGLSRRQETNGYRTRRCFTLCDSFWPQHHLLREEALWNAPLRSECAPSIHPDLIRAQWAKHFNQVFQHGTGTQIGLPEPVNAPERPSSEHYTLHKSIVKVWSALPLSLKTIRTAGPDEVEGQTVTSKLDVINQKEQATGDFVVRAREYICSENHRGSINYHRLDEIGELLRSFSEALRVASKRDGLADKSELSYFHEWTTNGLAEKIAYELKRDEHPCAHAKALSLSPAGGPAESKSPRA